MTPDYDAWKLASPDDDEQDTAFEEDSREGEDDGDICGQFYDGL